MTHDDGHTACDAQQIAYEYARRNANLVLVARREHRLFGIRDNARQLGAGQVLVIAADVVKEDDCRRLVADTVSYFGQRIYYTEFSIRAAVRSQILFNLSATACMQSLACLILLTKQN
jgi:NAD(P)-dependent dehydrogenase (short-subunit alcohol dehydrogenase family)